MKPVSILFLLLAAACARPPDPVPPRGAALEALLSGQRAVFVMPDLGALPPEIRASLTAPQVAFHPDGRAVVALGGQASSEGRWRVEGGAFCLLAEGGAERCAQVVGVQGGRITVVFDEAGGPGASAVARLQRL